MARAISIQSLRTGGAVLVLSLILTVNHIFAQPDDLNFGLAFDEQQGGGGLIGETVRLLNGNVVEFRSDLSLASPHRLGLSFAATYNSRSAAAGALGHGWSHTYSLCVDPNYLLEGQTYLKLVDETGRAAYFQEDTPGHFAGAFHEKSWIIREPGEYVWYRLNGFRFGFGLDGRLLWIEDHGGNRINLSYDGLGRLDTATDAASSRVLTFNYGGGNRIASISGPTTDAVPSGTWVSFGYDTDENLDLVTYADGSGVAYEYDDPNDVHNLTAKRNAAGHLMASWAYDGQDRCLNHFNPNGKGFAIVYPTQSQVDVTDAYSTVRTYTVVDFNGLKRLGAMQGSALAPYSESNGLRWEYDPELNLIEIEYGGGKIDRYQNHDARGNPATVISAAGTPEARTIQLTYHPAMNAVLSRTEPSVLGGGSKETIRDYDSDGDNDPNQDPTRLLYRLVEKGFTHDSLNTVVPYEYVTRFAYNSKGQVLSIDGPRPGTGDLTTLSYDSPTGNPLSITRPLIGTTGFSNHDAAGQAGQLTDVNGQSERFFYDGKGRVYRILHDADGSDKIIDFNPAGLPDIVTDEDDVISEFTYEPAYGRLALAIDMDENYIAYAYDAQGNRIERSTYEASGTRKSRKRFSYQHPSFAGRLWKEIQADDTFTEYDYNGAGQIASVTDPELQTTSYAYDPHNRLSQVTQPGNVLTRFGYDQHGGLSAVTDANSNVTVFVRDDMGRVLTETSPDTGLTRYGYDEAGNLIRRQDANGIIVLYAYDDLNRLTQENFPDPAQNVVYSYDAGAYGKGHRTGISDPSGTTSFTYDARGRLTGKQSVVSAVTYPLTRSFTAGGRMISSIYPSGRSLSFTRYPNGKVQKISTTTGGSPVTLADNLAYLPFGRARAMTTGAGGR